MLGEAVKSFHEIFWIGSGIKVILQVSAQLDPVFEVLIQHRIFFTRETNDEESVDQSGFRALQEKRINELHRNCIVC